MRAAIADDLDTRGALAAVDGWAERTLAGQWDDAGAPGLVARTVDAVLGVRLWSGAAPGPCDDAETALRGALVEGTDSAAGRRACRATALLVLTRNSRTPLQR